MDFSRDPVEKRQDRDRLLSEIELGVSVFAIIYVGQCDCYIFPVLSGL